MVDVDHFKAINDRHGHAEGDRALVHVARTLRESLRGGDLVARWGGEEFCVLLPRVREAEAQALAVRMAARIAASGEPRVTVSVVVAEARAHEESAEDVIRRANGALYRAKAAGRRPQPRGDGGLAGLSLLITGATGGGKTWLACALGTQAARSGFSVLYTRAARLFDELPVAHGDGTFARRLAQLAKLDLLVLDDFAISPIGAAERNDLLEVLD